MTEETVADTSSPPEDTESDESLDSLSKHLRRQATILSYLEKDTCSVPSDLGSLLEKHLFAPEVRPEATKTPDPKFNFYPPFLTPECLALHFPFSMCTVIPPSCKANRVGLPVYDDFCLRSKLDESLPDIEDKWDDSLGNVNSIAELKDNQKLVLLAEDYPRLSWMKTKCSSLKTYAFPSLAFPPVLQKILVESFIGKPQEPNKLDGPYELAITDDTLPHLSSVEKNKVREKMGGLATFGALLASMKKFFCHYTVVRNIHETLHYTFMHGFVRLINFLTHVNLSEYVTFHGLTYRNRLNNPTQHLQVEGPDKYDYVLDTIFLYCILTWQTAMDIFSQCIDESVQQNIVNAIKESKPKLMEATFLEGSVILSDIIFPKGLMDALVVNIPDFINQAQIGNFRSYINTKSGIPHSVCPAFCSDFVPVDYKESTPILWPHVFLLRHSAFLTNQGCYTLTPDNPSLSSSFCECNLCSPHRMPCYNHYLLNEILSIGKFTVQGEGDKTFSISPQGFANSYLKVFHPEDYFPTEVKLYCDAPEAFTIPLKACIIGNKKLLALLSETRERREESLLKRGSGVYKDPQTGEILAGSSPLLDEEEEDGRETIQTASRGQGDGHALSATGPAGSYWRGNTPRGDGGRVGELRWGTPKRGRAGRHRRRTGSRLPVPSPLTHDFGRAYRDTSQGISSPRNSSKASDKIEENSEEVLQ